MQKEDTVIAQKAPEPAKGFPRRLKPNSNLMARKFVASEPSVLDCDDIDTSTNAFKPRALLKETV